MNELTANIRNATEQDVPLILSFLHKKAIFDGCPHAVTATPERIARALFGPAPAAGVLLAEVDGVARGFLSYFSTYSSFLARPGLWMDDLYVDEEVRSHGIGDQLLRHLARMARKQECGRIEWTVNSENRRGIQFYQRHGTKFLEYARVCRLDPAAIARLAEARE